MYYLKDKVIVTGSSDDKSSHPVVGIIVGKKNDREYCVAWHSAPGLWWPIDDWKELKQDLKYSGYTELPFLTEEEFKKLGVKFGYFVDKKDLQFESIWAEVDKINKELNNEV